MKKKKKKNANISVVKSDYQFGFPLIKVKGKANATISYVNGCCSTKKKKKGCSFDFKKIDKAIKDFSKIIRNKN